MRDAGVFSIKRALPRMVSIFEIRIRLAHKFTCLHRAGRPKTYSIFIRVPLVTSVGKSRSRVPIPPSSNSAGNPRPLFAPTTATTLTKRFSNAGTSRRHYRMFGHVEKSSETIRRHWRSLLYGKKRKRTLQLKKRGGEWHLSAV